MNKMAVSSGSESSCDFKCPDDSHHFVDSSGWTNCQDSQSHQKSTNTIIKVLENQCLKQLKTIVENGWNVNEELFGYYPHQPLLYAITHSMDNEKLLEIVQLLLEHGANPNVTYSVDTSRHGKGKRVQRTALQETARLGLTEVVKMLLDAGAVCTTNDGLQNPLALALQTRKCPSDIIELLLAQGIDPNDHDLQFQNIPLLVAIANVRHCQNDVSIVQLLLNAGAKCKKFNGLPNPLTLALQNYWCPPELIELLLKHGADPNNHDNQMKNIPLFRAIWKSRGCRSKDTTIIELLLNAGAKCKMINELPNPLALALQICTCPADLIRLLLQHGADPNNHDGQFDNVPLLRAISNSKYCHQRSTTIVELLLAHGANANVKWREGNGKCGETRWTKSSALHEAIMLQRSKIAMLLVDAGAKCTNADGLQNPVVLAIERYKAWCCPGPSWPNLIELLLKHGADPNGQCENIPLVLAISGFGYYSRYHKNGKMIIQLLLAYGADPNAIVYKLREGWVQWTPFYDAVRLGWTEVVRMLIDAGAKCEISGGLDNPLSLAVENNPCNSDLIELLLKHGMDPNWHGKSQYYPLLYAIMERNDSKIVQLLLEHGANPNVYQRVNIGMYGRFKRAQSTPLHEAVRQGGTEVVKMLIDAGATYMVSDDLINPLALALQYYDCHPDLVMLLLRFGTDIQYRETTEGNEPLSLIHRLTQHNFDDYYIFLQQHLDLVFLHGGNIHIESYHRTALEDAIIDGCNSNSIRWLIRHGANALLRFSVLELHFMRCLCRGRCYLEIPLILLQAGIRVSHGARTCLSNMEVTVSTLLQENYVGRKTLIPSIWEQLKKTEQQELQSAPCNFKKSTILEYLAQQMADLQEFSDESLQSYPEDNHISDSQHRYETMLDQIQIIQEFLSQPQSLKWHCRCCVRENLVSLQPSVVKTLPIPAKLKQYILCHEV